MIKKIIVYNVKKSVCMVIKKSQVNIKLLIYPEFSWLVYYCNMYEMMLDNSTAAVAEWLARRTP